MCFAAKPHRTQVTFSDAQNGSELYFPMGPTKSIYSFCKKNISEINLKLAQSIYSLIYEGEGGLEGEARLGVGGFAPWVSFTCGAW